MADMPKFIPEDYENRVCCGVMEHFVASGYVFPFHTPVTINKEMSPISGTWAVTLYKKDLRSLQPNLRQSVSIYLTFCPFCGKRISDELPTK